MRILAAAIGGRPACRLVAEGLEVEITITGLSAEQMRYRLEGEGEPWRWTDLAGGDPISVELASPPRHKAAGGEPVVYENHLPDGHVRLVSGGGAQFRVEPGHVDTGGILPYCFHAAVAQQLARAGVMTLHAAGIATPKGGLLAIGPKGAGKSTLTASALRAGFGVVSDDWLLASFDGRAMQVERMRSFMMLRKGWATAQLRQYLPDVPVSESATRPRLHIRLPQDHPRFPCAWPLSSICLLERGRAGRPKQTRSEPLAASAALSALIESSMPIVLSDRLPVERACLFPAVSRMAGQACFRVQAGIDLIEASESAWRSLLAAVEPLDQGFAAVDPRAKRC